MAATMKGAISFGLLHVPVSLHTATQDNDIHFNQLCREDGSRVKYRKVCSKCGKEVSPEDIVKGFEIEPGRYVTLTEEDFEKAKVKKDKTIQILHFADLQYIRSIFFDKTYHAVPEAGGDKAYELLRKCMLKEKAMAIAKDGKPSFETIQRRSLMSNRFKIELEANRHPATFIAFDILYYNGKDLTMKPLEERKKALEKAVTESPRLAVSRVFDSSRALPLFQLAKEQGLEGMVAKKLGSLYFPGKRTKSWDEEHAGR